jgi:hypothetical protein
MFQVSGSVRFLSVFTYIMRCLAIRLKSNHKIHLHFMYMLYTYIVFLVGLHFDCNLLCKDMYGITTVASQQYIVSYSATFCSSDFSS